VSQPGQVHIVEIEYPSDVPQGMNLSIVEPNAAGLAVPIGLDSGVYVPADAPAHAAAGAAPAGLWPKTANRYCSSAAAKTPRGPCTDRFVCWGRGGLASRDCGWDLRLAAGLRHPPDIPIAATIVVGYVGRPLFRKISVPARSGCVERSKPGRLDHVYRGNLRLLQYAEYAGYNALIVSALADGSTIYPSTLLKPTPRYDTGAFFSTGQDPVRKDVLGLLFFFSNLQDRLLIPALDFSAPLPEIEAQLHRGGVETDGLELLGPTGATWLEKHATDRSAGAYYNCSTRACSRPCGMSSASCRTLRAQ